jgi:hypothetical protein
MPSDDLARAAATSTPAAELCKLAESPDPAVRRAVIHNPATPREALLQLATTDWWEVCRRPDGEAIMLERIEAANPYSKDLLWLRSLNNLHNVPEPIRAAAGRIGWMYEFEASGPDHRRMARENGLSSVDDIDD